MVENKKYSEVFLRLTYETAIVTFIKKDGTVRIMLCTRNLKTASLVNNYAAEKLGAHDKRCSIANGNVAVIDLELGEARSFGIDRVSDIRYLGEVTAQDLERVIGECNEYRNWFNQQKQIGE